MKKNNYYQIIRSNRKTLALEISDRAELIIRAPKKIPHESIKNFIFEKRFWIKRKQQLARDRLEKTVSKKFVKGEYFLFLGKMYRLSIETTGKDLLYLDSEFKLAESSRNNARQVFINWYKNKAFEIIKTRLDYYSKKSGINYNKFSISNAQKRWGSCQVSGKLFFAWRLIMAPLPVIDYVVVHELAHLQENNHSQQFWKKVRDILPDYQESRNWLKENGYLLVL